MPPECLWARSILQNRGRGAFWFVGDAVELLYRTKIQLSFRYESE
jgi:hypothetical protein